MEITADLFDRVLITFELEGQHLQSRGEVVQEVGEGGQGGLRCIEPAVLDSDKPKLLQRKAIRNLGEHDRTVSVDPFASQFDVAAEESYVIGQASKIELSRDALSMKKRDSPLRAIVDGEKTVHGQESVDEHNPLLGGDK